jgi:hypothetical protein
MVVLLVVVAKHSFEITLTWLSKHINYGFKCLRCSVVVWIGVSSSTTIAASAGCNSLQSLQSNL